MRRRWYSIRNANAPEAEILIYDVIGEEFLGEGVSAKAFIQDLRPLRNSDIHLRINSPGGDVFDGTAIYNALLGHSGRVRVTIDGLAASIASVVAMAGRTVTMPENAMMMVHDPWTMVLGNARELRSTADVLDKAALGIVGAYQRKSGRSSEEIAGLMSDETWMTGAEALELGFADQVSKPVALAAKVRGFVLGRMGFAHMPAALHPNLGETRTSSTVGRKVAIARRRMQLAFPATTSADSHDVGDYRWDR
jgi:ATP-dependent protease ClpP protease subunit